MSLALLLCAQCVIGVNAEAPVEILALDAKVREITALAISPDGKYQLASVGPANSQDVFRFTATAFDRFYIPSIGTLTIPQFITNRGDVVGTITLQRNVLL